MRTIQVSPAFKCLKFPSILENSAECTPSPSGSIINGEKKIKIIADPLSRLEVDEATLPWIPEDENSRREWWDHFCVRVENEFLLRCFHIKGKSPLRRQKNSKFE